MNKTIIVKYVTIPTEKVWEGDGLRGLDDDNVRRGIFDATYISRDDYDNIISKSISLLEAEEMATGIDRGTYACQILEACEDGSPDAIALDKKISGYLKSILRKIEYVEVEKIEGPIVEFPLKKLYIGNPEPKFRGELKKWGC